MKPFDPYDYLLNCKELFSEALKAAGYVNSFYHDYNGSIDDLDRFCDVYYEWGGDDLPYTRETAIFALGMHLTKNHGFIWYGNTEDTAGVVNSYIDITVNIADLCKSYKLHRDSQTGWGRACIDYIDQKIKEVSIKEAVRRSNMIRDSKTHK